MDFYIYRSDLPEIAKLAKQYAISALSHPSPKLLKRIADYGDLLKRSQEPDKFQSAAFCAAMAEVMQYNADYQMLTDDMQPQDVIVLENAIAVELATMHEVMGK